MMQPTFICSLTVFALLHPCLGAEYTVPSAVNRPTPYREDQPSATYSSLPTSQPGYTHHNGGPPCCRVVSKDGRCGAYNGGATCLGSGFGNCCGYVAPIINVNHWTDIYVALKDFAEVKWSSAEEDAIQTSVCATCRTLGKRDTQAASLSSLAAVHRF
jgi:hypothetical protein